LTRFVVLTALVPLLGSYARLFGNVRALPLAARVPVYFATGLVTLVAEMFLLTNLGVPWSFALLLPLPALLAIYALRHSEPRRGRRISATTTEATGDGRRILRSFASLRMTGGIAVISIGLLTMSVLAGMLTSGDFMIFWGVKGQRWGQARMLDYAFTLETPVEMHPDYPPLLPLYYAWTMLGGDGALNWLGATLTAPMWLSLTVLAIWGFGTYAGIRLTPAVAALFASAYSLFYLRNQVAGNGEPPLHFFEAVALAALICERKRGEFNVIAAIALTGVALTKVEGGVFVALVLLVLPWREKFRVGILPSAALLTWLAFAHLHGLTDTYVPKEDLSLQYILPTARDLVRELSLRLWYAPWLNAAILLVKARVRNALPYLAAAAGFILFLLSIYTRAEPHLEWSAGRTLMTPLLLVWFAVLAGNDEGASGGRAYTPGPV
jgi:hypothetical protein